MSGTGRDLSPDGERGATARDREIVLEDGSAQRHRRAPATGALRDGEDVALLSLSGLSDEGAP